jgi:sialate O-acetylesterase
MRTVLAALLLPVLGLAQTLTVTSGALDHQVFQRDAQDRATVTLQGTADGKAVEARVVAKKGGSGWKQIGKVEGTGWTGSINLATGGPYRLELRSGSATAAIDDVLVGDLWILAGQSNMEGVGNLIAVEAPNPLVHSFNQSDRWGIAQEPLHSLPDAVDRVHWRVNPETKQQERLEGEKLAEYIAKRKKGAGLGLPFAVEMLRLTGVPVGLIPCAHGGTSMDQWSPELKDKAGDSLYGATVRRVRVIGGKAKGILWYQGESDANPKEAPVFLTKFEKLVASFREDFGQPDLPFYYVQLGRHVSVSNMGEWNSVQESQRLAESRLGRGGMVAAINTALDDGIHVSTADHKRLGKNFAALACHDLFPNVAACSGVKRGPRPVEAKTAGEGLIRVTYSEVNGALQASGRVWGFTIHTDSGGLFPAIYKAVVDPLDPSAVLLYYGGKLPEGATLHYGAGKDPYCNLEDASQMAAPVFGPMPIL